MIEAARSYLDRMYRFREECSCWERSGGERLEAAGETDHVLVHQGRVDQCLMVTHSERR